MRLSAADRRFEWPKHCGARRPKVAAGTLLSRARRARGTSAFRRGGPRNRLIFTPQAKPLSVELCHSPAIFAAGSGPGHVYATSGYSSPKPWLTSSSRESSACSSVVPRGFQPQLGSGDGGQHQNSQDAFAVDPFIVLDDFNRRLELHRPLDEHVGWARVQSLWIANHDRSDCFVFRSSNCVPARVQRPATSATSSRRLAQTSRVAVQSTRTQPAAPPIGDRGARLARAS